MEEMNRTKKFAAAAGVLLAASWAGACPFCAKLTRSASDDIRESDAVFLAVLSDPRDDPTDGPSTAFRVLTVVKGRSEVESASRIASRVSSAARRPIERMIFAEIREGRLAPSKMLTVTPEYVRYLKELGEDVDRPQAERLRRLFAYLGSDDPQTSQDAYAEFAKSSYRSTARAAVGFDSGRLRSWLADASAASERVGLYGLLLGLCGGPSDAEFLSRLIEAGEPRHLPGLDGLLGGLCLLNRDRGVDWTIAMLAGDSSTPARRMAAMAALSFLLAESPPDDPSRLLERAKPALAHPEVASLLIDELRRGECWSAVDAVLGLAESERDGPAVLRYALACPEDQAKAFVFRTSHENPNAVRDAEQALEFERTARQVGVGR